MTPLVSVVMIFKDARPFLHEAARSVLDQTWPELELLLVDDGGTDGSTEVAVRLATAAPGRVRLLAHPGRANLGTGPSRRLGIEQARGELTGFLDGDDVWGPRHLEGEVALLLAHPEAGMVCGRCRVWHSWQHSHGRPGSTPPDRLNPPAAAPGVVLPPPRLLAAVLRNGVLATPTCSLLVRTDLLRTVTAEVARFASTYEDQVVNSLLQLRAPAVVSGADDAWYRQHAASVTAHAKRTGLDSTSRPSPARRAFLSWLAAQPELAPGRADPDVRALLDAQLRRQAPEPGGWGAATRRAARDGAARVVRRLPVPLRRALATARRGGPPDPEPLVEAFLALWAEDLRGAVAVHGAAARRAAETAGSRVTRLQVLDGPAARPAGAVGCLVLTPAAADGAALVRALSADPRAGLARDLAPGGTLLLATTAPAPVEQVRGLLAGPFAAHLLEVHEHALGPGGLRLLTARGLRPA